MLWVQVVVRRNYTELELQVLATIGVFLEAATGNYDDDVVCVPMLVSIIIHIPNI